MCGIAGIANNYDRSSASESLRGMIKAMHHRGPDGEYFLDNRQISLGMCRLSINDLNGGIQPYYNADKSVAVFYNGEIYNYRELKSALENSGIKFLTNCDGEVIAHLYDRYGCDAFGMLDGMFAIAVFHVMTGNIILARDIAGEKPLYYYQKQDKYFAFASELTAFKSLKDLSLTLNRQAIWDLPTFLWVPEPETIFNEVLALPRGHYLIIKEGKLTLKEFKFANKKISFNSCNDSDFINETRYTVESAIKARLLSDVKVGSFLSGGLDSSIVATIAAKELGQIDTFSVGFENLFDPYHGSVDESEQAALTATHIRSKHHLIRVTSSDLLKKIDKFVEHMGQPFAVSSGLGVLSVAEHANSLGVKVLLSGDGADECFGGYSWYAHLSKLHDYPIFECNNFSSMQDILAPVDQILKNLSTKSRPERVWGMHYYAHEVEKNNLFSPDFSINLKSSLRHFDESSKRAWSPIDYVKHDRNFYFPNEMLTKVDRMTMAYSVEGRVPFAAPSVLGLSEKLNFSQMVSGDGTLKPLLRKAFDNILLKDVVTRPKHGFNIPVDAWLRNEWRHLVAEAFCENSQLHKRGIITKDSFKEAMSLIENKNRLSGHTIFSFIILNKWLEAYAN